MEHNIAYQIAQAERRGEHDYADELRNMVLPRQGEAPAVHINNLDENLRQGLKSLERRIRGAA